MKNVVQDLTSAGLLGVWGKWVKHAKYISRETIKNLCDYSGFFPASEEKIEQWADLYLRCLPQMDLCAVFDNHTEDYRNGK